MANKPTRRAFPKFLLAFLLLAVAVGAVYLFAVTPSEDVMLQRFRSFGEFICKYDAILIGFLLAVNLVEIIDIFIFAKRDETINASFLTATGKSVGFTTLFFHYFSGAFANGPYIFATQEQKSALPRVIISLVTGIIKFISWLAFLVMIAGISLHPGVYEFALGEGIDYAFTLFVLYLCLNCHVLVYALYRCLPLHEVREYVTITYYSDGSQTRGKSYSSNLIAILFMAGILYLFYSAYYVVPFAGKLARCIETGRFNAHLDKSDYNECIWHYYG